ncbi:MAG: tail fiber domain-containing protein [Bacteroidia bacterium]|nr:tail fiber domain-containing protein [Bacteroidia bacterium]
MHIFRNFLSVAIIYIMIAGLFHGSKAQNIAITDDDGYTAHSSAMLDVKSLTKGLLIPRLSTAQRLAITGPATGLLVFDTSLGNFYFYNGVDWINLTSGNANGIWSLAGSSVYLTNPVHKVGVGTSAPVGKLEVKGDVPTSSDAPLFEVINSAGDTIFAVYSQGVRIYVADDPAVKAVGSRSGFAVGGFSQTKGITNEYLRVTPDSVRIYIEDTSSAKAAGSKGGFAVGGFSQTKGLTNKYLAVTDATTQVYISDSTAGFGVTNIESGTDQSLMDLSTQNYFIGHESGQLVTSGIYNQFIGYKSGFADTSGSYNCFFGYKTGYNNIGGSTVELGSENSFFGYMAGYSNQDGYRNIFIGPKAGYSNNGGWGNLFIGTESGFNCNSGFANTCIGNESGKLLTWGWSNILIGPNSGYSVTNGNQNLFIGVNAGLWSNSSRSIYIGTEAGFYSGGTDNIFIGMKSGMNNTAGSDNVFIGDSAGLGSTGSANVFLGRNAGSSETGSNKLYIDNSGTSTPLIYGDFASDYVTINGNLNMADTYFHIVTNPGTGTTPTNYCYQGAIGSATKQYAFSIYDALWVTDVAWFDESVNIDVSGSSALNIAGDEAIWYDGTYFSWGYGGTYNYFADKVGIGLTSPYYKLELPNNSAVTAGCGRAYAWNIYSDSRIKKNQENLTYGLSELLRLQPKKYNHYDSEFKDGKLALGAQYINTIGLIAQEVYDIIPEAVEKPANEAQDLWSLDYQKLIPVLINGIKEQQQEIETIKRENKSLLQKIEQIDKQNTDLKAEIDNIKKLLKNNVTIDLGM